MRYRTMGRENIMVGGSSTVKMGICFEKERVGADIARWRGSQETGNERVVWVSFRPLTAVAGFRNPRLHVI